MVLSEKSHTLCFMRVWDVYSGKFKNTIAENISEIKSLERTYFQAWTLKLFYENDIVFNEAFHCVKGNRKIGFKGEESLPSLYNYETFHLCLFKVLLFCFLLFCLPVFCQKVWEVGGGFPGTKPLIVNILCFQWLHVIFNAFVRKVWTR